MSEIESSCGEESDDNVEWKRYSDKEFCRLEIC